MDLCTYNINATIVVLEKEHPHTQKNFRNYQKCLFVALAVIFFVRARQEHCWIFCPLLENTADSVTWKEKEFREDRQKVKLG